MEFIVAVDENWAIGKGSKLLYHVPEDLQFFKEKTTGGLIIMGRKTLESLPKGRPLPNRTNVVLTRDRDYQVDGATVLHSFDELAQFLATHPKQRAFVIGGAEIYHALLPYCQGGYVTKIAATAEADYYFDNLDNLPGWQMVEDGEVRTSGDLTYRHTRYEQTGPHAL